MRFHLMKLLVTSSGTRFDYLMPIYNWFYPVSGHAIPGSDCDRSWEALLRHRSVAPPRTQALYVHVPFCRHRCAFCPFLTSPFDPPELRELYALALAAEIRKKAQCAITASVPVRAIFFGGGSPSSLSSEQLRIVVSSIRDEYDLSQLEEFSFEIAYCDVTPAYVETLRELGVTHPRFGIQTFDPVHRRLFGLAPDISRIRQAADVLSKHFPHVSVDMLFGMHGQSDVSLRDDIAKAASLPVTNIDYYPINLLVVKPALHRAYQEAGLHPLSGPVRFRMNMTVRDLLRELGFLAHNGHGYVRTRPGTSLSLSVADSVVTDAYSFVYHEHVFGYPDQELLGFGTGAISKIRGYSFHNSESLSRYIMEMLDHDGFAGFASANSPGCDAAKPLVVHLPYHGDVQKNRIDWSYVPSDTASALEAAIAAGLIRDTGDRLSLTLQGWYWYVNLMYYLAPSEEKAAMDSYIGDRLRAAGPGAIDVGAWGEPYPMSCCKE